MTDSPFQSQLDSAMRQLREQIDSFQARRDAVAAMVGEGTAADGLVTVRTGAGGVLQDIELDPRAMRMASQDLRDAILEAARNAAANYQEALADILPTAPVDVDKLVRDFGVGGQLGNAMAEFKQRTGDVEQTLAKLRKDLGL
jgi:DNA-binding protein YbaB